MIGKLSITPIDQDTHMLCVPAIVGIGDTTTVASSDNLLSQADKCVEILSQRLERADASLSDLVKLVVYYVQDGVEESLVREQLGVSLGRDVTTCVTLVPLRQLAELADLANRFIEKSGEKSSGQPLRVRPLIEIEAYAIVGNQRRAIVIDDSLSEVGPSFCHGLSCGDFSFVSGQSSSNRSNAVLYPGDLVSQNQQTIENLQRVLEQLPVSSADIVKVNSWRAPTGNIQDYQRAAEARFTFLERASPAVTGITIPGLAAIGHVIRLDLWAMSSALPRVRLNPDDHWGWKIQTSYSHGIQVGDWLFVGGQAALDQHCEVCSADDAISQVDLTVDYIDAVITSSGHQLVEIFSLNGWYCTNAEGFGERSLYKKMIKQYLSSAPACTVVPVDSLAYPDQAVELDAIVRCR